MEIVPYRPFANLGKKALLALGGIATTGIVALADITSDMANFTQIIGNSSAGFTGMVVGMLGIFMTPPLLYFVVLGIFVTIIHIAAGLLMKRGKR